MSEGGSIHPGSWIGDSVEEFKKLPIWGKIAVVVVAVGAVVLAVHLHNQAQASSSSSGTSNGAIDSGPLGGAGSQLPPANFGPLPNQPGPGPTPGPTPPVGPPAGQPGIPLIPFGQYNGPSYSNLPKNTWFTWQGTKYLLSTGAGGRLYGQANGQGNQILLYGPQSSYNPPPGGTGGGPDMNTSTFMSNPAIYSQAAAPHVPSTVPH
jgi:hypothetical protein